MATPEQDKLLAELWTVGIDKATRETRVSQSGSSWHTDALTVAFFVSSRLSVTGGSLAVDAISAYRCPREVFHRYHIGADLISSNPGRGSLRGGDPKGRSRKGIDLAAPEPPFSLLLVRRAEQKSAGKKSEVAFFATCCYTTVHHGLELRA